MGSRICSRCGTAVTNLRKHLARNRCMAQGREGTKADTPSGIKERRIGNPWKDRRPDRQ